MINKGMKNMLKEAVDSHDFEPEALAIVRLIKIFRHEIFEQKSFHTYNSETDFVIFTQWIKYEKKKIKLRPRLL